MKKYDMVWDLFKAMAMHADWELPVSGFAHDVLHLDEWGSRDADPIGWVLEHAWHNNAAHQWDPLTAAFNLTASTLR